MDKIARSIESFIRSIIGLEDLNESLLEAFLPQLIATTLLFIIIKFTIWKQITALLDARRYYIETEIKDAEKHKKQAIENETRTLARLKEIESESNSIIEEAKNKAVVQANTILEKANEEAATRIDRALAEIENETNKAKLELKQEFGTLVLLAAEKIIEKEIDGNKYNSVIEETVKGFE